MAPITSCEGQIELDFTLSGGTLEEGLSLADSAHVLFSCGPSNRCLITLNSSPGERRWSAPSAKPKPKAASSAETLDTYTALRGEPRADEATSFIYVVH